MKFVYCLNTTMKKMCADIIGLCENEQSKPSHKKFSKFRYKYYQWRLHFRSPPKAIPFVESAQYNCRHTG
jgi:hypothetical protein